MTFLYLVVISTMGNSVTAQEKTYTIPITVESKTSGSMHSLSPADVELYENNNRIKVVSFSAYTSPISIGIVIDASPSVAGQDNAELLGELSELKRFISHFSNENEYFLTLITGSQVLNSEPMQNRNDVITALDNLIRKFIDNTARGNTRLYDAIQSSLERMDSAKFDQKLLIVVSDGEDNVSKTYSGALKRSARLRNVLIFCIKTFGMVEPVTVYGMQSIAFLYELTELTGGRVFKQGPRDQVGNWREELIDVLKNVYFVEILVKVTPNKPTWRELKVRPSNEFKTRFGSVSFRTRKGIYH